MFKSLETWTPRRYAFFITWFILHVILFIFGFLRVKLNPELVNLNVPLGASLWIARGGGMCLIWDCSIILLPVCRNILRILRVSFVNKLIPVDENIWFHKITAYSIVVCTTIHAIGHYVNFYKMDAVYRKPHHPAEFNMSAAELLYKSPAGITGHIMLLCMVLMYTTAKQSQRNKSFESFWYTHHLAFVMLGALMFHGIGCIVRDEFGVCRGYDSYRYLAIGYVLYIIERCIRAFRARMDTRLVKAIQHPAGVIELQIQKPSFKYKPGQYLFICVPDVSNLQWHPFTITSSPFEDYVSVHIRQVGDWTRALGVRMGVEKEERGGGRGGENSRGMQAAKRQEKNIELVDDRGEEIHVRAGFSMPAVCIDGPFGAPTEDVFDHEIVVLVGSGIGVTPFASILRDIWYRANNNMPLKTKRIEFYWVCRDLASLKWFQSLLSTIEQSMLHVKLNIHIYCTAVMKPDQHHNIALHLHDDFTGADTITGLRALTNFGRPNFGAIFTELREGIMNGTYMPGATQELVVDVAVFFCGPGAMAKSLRKESRLQSKNGVKFTFRKEHF
ncbi:hypothetical protein BGZ49_000531 [Haplosporangium sp. Z 27]|nr:hypothetical protein BGZ49_000531 [Haplosporangium sp. Z 27]